MITFKKGFPREFKTALTQPIYKGKGNQRESDNHTGISPPSVVEKIYSDILARRLKDLQIYNKKLGVFQKEFIKRRKVNNIFTIKHVLISA
jgi:hypothetical protein